MVGTYPCKINQMDGRLLEWLRHQPIGEQIGAVHSVFDKVVNFITDDGTLLFSLAKNEVVQSPGMMKTFENFYFSEMCSTLKLTKQVCLVDYCLLKISDWQWDFSKAVVWNRAINPPRKAKKETTFSSLQLLNHFILHNGATGGVFPAWKSFTYPDWEVSTATRRNIYFYNFMEGFNQLEREIKADMLDKSIFKFAGLGIGLTPSGDDFLTGLLATWQYYDEAHLYEKVESHIAEWLQKLKGRTTTVSYFMLKQCLEGQVNEALLDVLENLDNNPISHLQRLVEIGSTSGTDMLIGVSVAYQQLINYKEGKHNGIKSIDRKKRLS
jgi:hypothetical protein